MSRDEMKAIIQQMKEPIVTKAATERVIKILDSKYERANLKLVVEGAKHLTQKERILLYNLLVILMDR